jgi:hypothetical protein
LNFELALFCLQLVVSAYQLTVTGLFVWKWFRLRYLKVMYLLFYYFCRPK